MTAIPFSEALKVWLHIGLFSFGGPAAQIAILHRETVEERKWLSEQQFLSALNFCMLLPGPEAMQLATYTGWRLHGVKGGLAAGLLFVFPGACVVLALSLLYVTFGEQPLIAACFWGLKAAVLAIVLEALIRVSKKAIRSQLDAAIAITAFIALFCFAVPFPIVIFVAALLGFMQPNENALEPSTAAWPSFSATLSTLMIWLAIWFVPLGVLWWVLGDSHILTELAQFFSKLAVVTFGGAYAVLSYMGQDVVEAKNWLTAKEMMDGLALAETTPGPLILVGQFVAFLAVSKLGASLVTGILASVVFLWMTFVPCFMFIFVGAPYIEHIQKMPRLSRALRCITAAVAGVILNLTLWFSLNVLFGKVARLPGVFQPWMPELSTMQWGALGISLISGVILLYYKQGIPKTLALAAGIGVIWQLTTASL
jgi:chromate transporter